MNTSPIPHVRERLQALDLTKFSLKSRIPRRTLERIRAEDNYPMTATTKLALEAALKRYESRCKKAGADAE